MLLLSFFQADASLFNQTASPDKLPNQQCLLTSIPEHAQRTLRDVTNLVVLPLETLLALLSVTCNTVIVVAILRTRSIQRPSMLLLGSLSVTDVIWAILSAYQNIKFFVLKNPCPEEADVEELFVGVLCFFSTLGSLAMISYDRLMAVSNPLWYRSQATRSRTIKQIAMVWVIGLIIAVIGSGHDHFPSVSSKTPYIGSAVSICYGLTIIGCYIGVLIANCRHKASMHLYRGPMRMVLKRQKKIVNTVALILLVSCLTLLPSMIIPLVFYHYNGSTPSDATPLRPLRSIFVTLNGLLNPLLNYGRDKDVRRTVRSLIRCQICCGEGCHIGDVDEQQRRRNQFTLKVNNRVTADSH